MFAVGVRCVQFLSRGEAISYFEEEMKTTFGEGQSVDTHFCQWLVSISLHSNFVSNISKKKKKYRRQVLPRALDRLGLRFVLNLERPHSFSKGVKLTEEASLGIIRDLSSS